MEIKGYTDQPREHIDLVNNNKMVEEQTLQMLDEASSQSHSHSGVNGVYQ